MVYSHLWFDERIFPSYIAIASLIILFLQGLWASKPVKLLRGVDTDDAPELPKSSRGFVEKRGGIIIVAFKVARLAGVVALLQLSAITAIKHGFRLWDLALAGTLVRALLFYNPRQSV